MNEHEKRERERLSHDGRVPFSINHLLAHLLSGRQKMDKNLAFTFLFALLLIPEAGKGWADMPNYIEDRHLLSLSLSFLCCL